TLVRGKSHEGRVAEQDHVFPRRRGFVPVRANELDGRTEQDQRSQAEHPFDVLLLQKAVEEAQDDRAVIRIAAHGILPARRRGTRATAARPAENQIPCRPEEESCESAQAAVRPHFTPAIVRRVPTAKGAGAVRSLQQWCSGQAASCNLPVCTRTEVLSS